MQKLDFLTENKARREKWASVTDGIEDNMLRRKTESVLATTEEYMMHEDTSTANIAVFTKQAKPLIRRIMPALIANQIISVQPTKMPTTKVFYQDFVYADTLAPVTAGDRIDWQAGKFSPLYSSGTVKGETPTGVADGTNHTFNTKNFPLKGDTITVYVNSAVVTNYTIDETTGAIVFASGPANGATVRCDYALDMEQVGSKGNTRIAGIDLAMSSATVDTEEKRIAARWSKNAEQDFKAYFDGNVEDELTRKIGDMALLEIDRLVIQDLYSGATAGNVNWSQTVPTGVKVSDHYETLMHAIADASMDIYRKRLRHANFIVCSPDAINILDKTNRMVLASGMGKDGFSNSASIQSGPNVFGQLSSRYTVITDPMFPTNKILVGFNGSDWDETGYVLAPYSMFYTDTFLNPETMKSVKGLAARFGRHLVNGDFYATVTITA